MSKILQTIGLTKSFPGLANDHVDLEIEEGEFTDYWGKWGGKVSSYEHYLRALPPR